MAFPGRPFSDHTSCQMILEIKHTRVQRLAITLFSVEVEIAGEIRSLYFPNGMKTIPHPHLRILGCEYEAIRSTFGDEIYNGIKASLKYQDDLKNGNPRTSCVSMVISQRSQDSAFICISLGLTAATSIRCLLFD